MTMVEDIFKARADSFGETMIGGSGILSLKLPEYQRPYDWDLEQCAPTLAGLPEWPKKGRIRYRRAIKYTFLGTVIFTSDESKEATFAG